MKRFTAFLVALLFASSALAVDLTITLTAEQAQRFAAAVGADNALKNGAGAPRSATSAEARQDVIRYMRVKTQEYERRLGTSQLVIPAFEPDPPQ